MRTAGEQIFHHPTTLKHGTSLRYNRCAAVGINVKNTCKTNVGCMGRTVTVELTKREKTKAMKVDEKPKDKPEV